MSHSYIDRSSQNGLSQGYESNQPQRKIDPVAQLKALNDNRVRDWGLFDDPPAQLFARDEEEEKTQAKIGDEPLQKKAVHGTSGTATQLPSHVQAKMGSSFGTNFSSVDIHTNSEQATNMGALAYTQGNDVHFAPGQYNPGSPKGQELIGHELTHVVQQRQGRVTPTKQGKGLPVNDNPALEKEADEMGAKAAQGKMADVAGKGSGVQRKSTNDFSPDHEVDAGGTETQKKTIKLAMENAYKMVDKAQIYMGGNKRDRYKKWFDANYSATIVDDVNRHAGVSWGFIKLHSVLKSKTVKLNFDNSKADVYAYVYPNDGQYKISLGPAFWTASDVGRDSKAGTIVHELSHEELGTDDHVYGAAGAENLAINDPGKACSNADNYEFFAEDSY